MAAASVLAMPQYNIVYPPYDTVSTMANVVTTNIAAFQNSDGVVQSLTVGASSNIVAQAVNNIFLEHGLANTMTLSTTNGSTVAEYMTVGMSNSRVTIKDLNYAGLTMDTRDTYIGDAHFVQDASSLTLSMPSLSVGLIVDPAVAMQSTLAVALDTSLNQNLFVTGDTGMGGRLVTYGGIYTPDVAIFKASTIGGAAQVGYTWKINANDQLELIKYSFFGSASDAVAKKVAVFGNSSIASADTSDVVYSASRIISASSTEGGGGGGGTPGFTNASTAFTVTASGEMYTMNNLTIGTTTTDPTLALQIVGTTQSTTLVATENTSSPAFLTTSDERLKDLYDPISGPAALNGIMGLSPLTYSWKTDETHVRHAGFTAQNIGAQLPLAVQTTPAGTLEDALHIDNTAVIAYLVAAVQELGKRIIIR